MSNLISISQYWSRLRDSVHPEDEQTFRRHAGHGFNLDFPPPAFIGDIANAPIIILDNNGGYEDSVTRSEFPDLEARDEYRKMLSTPRPVDPKSKWTSRYYLERNYFRWLISGEAALVNGVAYRSVDGGAKAVARLTKELPSARFHQQWLREKVAPMAARKERFVVVHRWTRWNDAADVLRGLSTAIFSSAPVRPDLTRDELAAANAFLAARRAN